MRLLPILLASTLVAASASAQSYQTLPRGFDTTPANSSTGFPFGLNGFWPAHIWQWHYDSSQFDAAGPVEITEVWIRTVGAGAGTYDFPDVEVTMASSPTDYSVAGNGIQPGHDPVFANNLNSDATVVRPAAPFMGNDPAGVWIPLGLTGSFVYDPTLGDDFVFQLTHCGGNDWMSGGLEGQSGPSGTVFGNRYGDRTDCQATSQTFFNDEFVPVIRIEYAPVQTGPSLSVSSGAPGGQMTFDFANFTANAAAALVYGPGGQYTVPGGGCAGLVVDVLPLNFPPLSALILVNTDANGDAQLTRGVPAAGAGLTLQAVDVPSCTASNTVVL